MIAGAGLQVSSRQRASEMWCLESGLARSGPRAAQEMAMGNFGSQLNPKEEIEIRSQNLRSSSLFSFSLSSEAPRGAVAEPPGDRPRRSAGARPRAARLPRGPG